MCLAFPGKIESISGEMAVVDYGGVKKSANVSFVEGQVGEWVLVHVGFAIEKVDEERARGMYNLLAREKPPSIPPSPFQKGTHKE